MSATTSSLSVMVVDGSARTRKTLRRTLEQDGYAVTAVGDARRARESLRRRSPEAIILDVSLPGGDGCDIARSIRGGDRDLAILFFSSLDDTNSMWKGWRAGADTFVSKRVGVDGLVSELERVLRARQGIH